VLIDGTPFKHRWMIVALGISCDGRKTVQSSWHSWPTPFSRRRFPVELRLL